VVIVEERGALLVVIVEEKGALLVVIVEERGALLVVIVEEKGALLVVIVEEKGALLVVMAGEREKPAYLHMTLLHVGLDLVNNQAYAWCNEAEAWDSRQHVVRRGGGGKQRIVPTRTSQTSRGMLAYEVEYIHWMFIPIRYFISKCMYSHTL
jgi:hypothetical protein